MLKGNQVLTPLEADLALSQASLAAAKAKIGMRPSSSEFSSISQLTASFECQLSDCELTSEIPENLVPDPRIRHLLEEGLAKLISARQECAGIDVNLLKKLLPILKQFTNNKMLPVEQADELLNGFRELNKHPQPIKKILQFEDGYRALHT